MHGATSAGTRAYAIGDIHGCRETLESLLAKIVADDARRPAADTRKLIFLGDYVDRGDDSRGVVDLMLDDLPEGFEAIFLKGNHEAMLLDCLDGTHPMYHWFLNGGRTTLESYGIPCKAVDGEYDYDLFRHRFREQLPARHLDFYRNLEISHRCGDYFFVHAGVNPDRPLDEQREEDMLWIRDRFLFAVEDFGAVIVHGHTPVDEADIFDNRIGIDTGAVYGGALTAICLDGTEQHIIQVKTPKPSGRMRR